MHASVNKNIINYRFCKNSIVLSNLQIILACGSHDSLSVDVDSDESFEFVQAIFDWRYSMMDTAKSLTSNEVRIFTSVCPFIFNKYFTTPFSRFEPENDWKITHYWYSVSKINFEFITHYFWSIFPFKIKNQCIAIHFGFMYPQCTLVTDPFQ